MQYQLMKFISAKRKRVTIVGDPDQSSASDPSLDIPILITCDQFMGGGLQKSQTWVRCVKVTSHAHVDVPPTDE